MSPLTRRDLMKIIMGGAGCTKNNAIMTTNRIISSMEDALVLGRGIEIREFASMYPYRAKERKARNPLRPEVTIVVPQRTVVRLKMSKRLRRRLAEHPEQQESDQQQAANAVD